MLVQRFTLHMHIWNARAGAMNALAKMGTQPQLQAWVGLTCDHRPRVLHHLGRFVTDSKTCHRISFDVVMVHAARAHASDPPSGPQETSPSGNKMCFLAPY